MKKIFEINELAKTINGLKEKNKTTVLCHGVFDLVHIGHIKHFKEAKKNGDFLVVSLTSDDYVNKGNGRPVFNQNLRAEFLESISFVDAIIINHEATAVNLISKIKPNIYFKGPDYKDNSKDKTKNIFKEIRSIKKVGGKIIYSNDITFSSSNLINTHFNFLKPEQKNFIDTIKKKYSIDVIIESVNKFIDNKILLIGETIIDQYIFGNVLGKAGKEPHLVFNEKSTENFLGGAGAISNHLSSFCKSINFFTLGNKYINNIKFIRKSLKKNIKLKLFFDKNFKTIRKTRFVDKFSQNKIYGSYSFDNNFCIKDKLEKKIINQIKIFSAKSDIVLISDYGHGFISNNIGLFLGKIKSFVSVNAQMNSSNQNFYTLEKYKNIDFLLINQNELRNAMRDKSSKLEDLAISLMKKLDIRKLIITKGSDGSIFFEKNKNAIFAPALAKRVIDKVGAGDTMLATVALCIKNNIPSDLALFLGSIAAGSTVENIGNSKYIDKINFLRQIEFILK